MYQSDVAPLRRVLLKHARDAFVSPARIFEQWEGLDYLDPPDFDDACRESDEFASLLEGLGVAVEWMPADDAGLDSIYVRDAAVVSNTGATMCRMGKASRALEPGLLARAFDELGVRVRGVVGEPGRLEGGDATWLRPDWLAVGVGARTNGAGVAQLHNLVGNDVEISTIELPAVYVPGDVFHLMSVLSPLAEDLVLAYEPLIPRPLRDALLQRDFRIVHVPPEEWESQGCNVLAVAPRLAVALEDNPITRERMEAAGVEVHGYRGREISVKGCGGPTCLTRPLERDQT